MAQINLVVDLINNDPLYVSSNIRYARIDNTSTPIYTNIPNVSGTMYIIQNIPNGQYIIGVTPNFSDGRSCPEITKTTVDCSGIIAFNAVLDIYNPNQIDVTYTADNSLGNIQWNVGYPNGGFANGIIANGDYLTIPIPSNVYGNYTVTLQAVCDIATGWIGQPTNAIVILKATPTGSVLVQAEPNFSTNVVSGITGIAGFTFSGTMSAGGSQSGTHTAFTSQTIAVSITGAATSGNGVDIIINGGSPIGRITLSGGAGTYTYTGLTVLATDSIVLDFNNNL